MPIDMTKLLLDQNERPIADSLAASPEDPADTIHPSLTIGRAVFHALCANFPDEANLGWEVKLARGQLAYRIRDATDAEFSTEELVVVKRLVGRMFLPQLIYQLIPYLDPGSKPGPIS